MVIRNWCRGKRTSYDNDLEISDVAATNVPAKPLRNEGIRCIMLSHGSRSYPGIETAAGLSVAVAQQESPVQLALAGGRDSCRVYRGYMFLDSYAGCFLDGATPFGPDGGGVQGSRDVR